MLHGLARREDCQLPSRRRGNQSGATASRGSRASNSRPRRNVSPAKAQAGGRQQISFGSRHAPVTQYETNEGLRVRAVLGDDSKVGDVRVRVADGWAPWMAPMLARCRTRSWTLTQTNWSLPCLTISWPAGEGKTCRVRVRQRSMARRRRPSTLRRRKRCTEGHAGGRCTRRKKNKLRCADGNRGAGGCSECPLAQQYNSTGAAPQWAGWIRSWGREDWEGSVKLDVSRLLGARRGAASNGALALRTAGCL